MNLGWENRTIPGGIAVLSGLRHEADGRAAARGVPRLVRGGVVARRRSFAGGVVARTNCGWVGRLGLAAVSGPWSIFVAI